MTRFHQKVRIQAAIVSYARWAIMRLIDGMREFLISNRIDIRESVSRVAL